MDDERRTEWWQQRRKLKNEIKELEKDARTQTRGELKKWENRDGRRAIEIDRREIFSRKETRSIRETDVGGENRQRERAIHVRGQY